MFLKANYHQLIENGMSRNGFSRRSWMKNLKNANLFRKKHQTNIIVGILTVLCFITVYYIFFEEEYPMTIEIIDRADDFEKMKKNSYSIWTLTNLTYYSKLNESPLNLSTFTWSNKGDNEDSFPGYWVFRQSSHDGALITIENLRPVHISFGISLAVYGNAKITVVHVFPDYPAEPPHTTYYNYQFNNELYKLRFCSKIFQDHKKENKLLTPYKIEIKFVFEYGSNFLIIDKMYLTTGNNGASENFIYTIIPEEWCGKLISKKL